MKHQPAKKAEATGHKRWLAIFPELEGVTADEVVYLSDDEYASLKRAAGTGNLLMFMAKAALMLSTGSISLPAIACLKAASGAAKPPNDAVAYATKIPPMLEEELQDLAASWPANRRRQAALKLQRWAGQLLCSAELLDLIEIPPGHHVEPGDWEDLLRIASELEHQAYSIREKFGVWPLGRPAGLLPPSFPN